MPRVAQDTPLSDVIVDDSQTDQIQYISGPSTGNSDGKWTHTSNIEEDFYYQGTLSSATKLWVFAALHSFFSPRS